jgi:prepilin-type N-terminal cleavage/methylation domain-containing protein
VNKKRKSPNGFTLIELLVVLVIIAILSTIAIISYTGLQTRARDSVRRTYLSDLVTALEINKGTQSYMPLQSSQMSILQSTDPRGYAYCIAPSPVSDPAFLVPWEGVCPGGFEVVGEGIPAAPYTSFKVCTYLEQPDSGQPHVFCKSGTL